MKKRVIAVVLALVALGAFAGGEAETGRSSAADQVLEGQLLPVGTVDPGTYLTDFESDVTNTGDEPLLLRVDLLQDKIWEKGGLTSFRIVLAVNEEDFFPLTPGLFVMFFQNPELLRNSTFVNDVDRIIALHEGLDIRIFDAANEELLPASTYGEFMEAVDATKGQAKIYDQNKLIQRALGTMSAEGSPRSHLLWVTDENIAERTADLTFFDFAVELLAGTNTTFSYLAYGELPNWPAVNETLLKRNGNSYYAQSTADIPAKIERDLGYFHRPAVEDLEVTIDLGRTITERNVFYPSDYYGTMPTFYPTFSNNRPRSVHLLGGMNYGEVRRFIHYIYVPSYLDMLELAAPTPLFDNRSLTVGRVFLRYVLPKTGETIYLQRDLTLDYVDADSAPDITIDPMVELDTIIQNTPLIMLEAGRLVNNNRDYLVALKLLQAQMALLHRLGPARPDEAVDEDWNTLKSYYDLVFEQAKSVNLLE